MEGILQAARAGSVDAGVVAAFRRLIVQKEFQSRKDRGNFLLAVGAAVTKHLTPAAPPLAIACLKECFALRDTLPPAAADKLCSQMNAAAANAKNVELLTATAAMFGVELWKEASQSVPTALQALLNDSLLGELAIRSSDEVAKLAAKALSHFPAPQSGHTIERARMVCFIMAMSIKGAPSADMGVLGVVCDLLSSWIDVITRAAAKTSRGASSVSTPVDDGAASKVAQAVEYMSAVKQSQALVYDALWAAARSQETRTPAVCLLLRYRALAFLLRTLGANVAHDQLEEVHSAAKKADKLSRLPPAFQSAESLLQHVLTAARASLSQYIKAASVEGIHREDVDARVIKKVASYTSVSGGLLLPDAATSACLELHAAITLSVRTLNVGAGSKGNAWSNPSAFELYNQLLKTLLSMARRADIPAFPQEMYAQACKTVVELEAVGVLQPADSSVLTLCFTMHGVAETATAQQASLQVLQAQRMQQLAGGDGDAAASAQAPSMVASVEHGLQQLATASTFLVATLGSPDASISTHHSLLLRSCLALHEACKPAAALLGGACANPIPSARIPTRTRAESAAGSGRPGKGVAAVEATPAKIHRGGVKPVAAPRRKPLSALTESEEALSEATHAIESSELEEAEEEEDSDVETVVKAGSRFVQSRGSTASLPAKTPARGLLHSREVVPSGSSGSNVDVERGAASSGVFAVKGKLKFEALASPAPLPPSTPVACSTDGSNTLQLFVGVDVWASLELVMAKLLHHAVNNPQAITLLGGRSACVDMAFATAECRVLRALCSSFKAQPKFNFVGHMTLLGMPVKACDGVAVLPYSGPLITGESLSRALIKAAGYPFAVANALLQGARQETCGDMLEDVAALASYPFNLTVPYVNFISAAAQAEIPHTKSLKQHLGVVTTVLTAHTRVWTDMLALPSLQSLTAHRATFMSQLRLGSKLTVLCGATSRLVELEGDRGDLSATLRGFYTDAFISMPSALLSSAVLPLVLQSIVATPAVVRETGASVAVSALAWPLPVTSPLADKARQVAFELGLEIRRCRLHHMLSSRETGEWVVCLSTSWDNAVKDVHKHVNSVMPGSDVAWVQAYLGLIFTRALANAADMDEDAGENAALWRAVILGFTSHVLSAIGCTHVRACLSVDLLACTQHLSACTGETLCTGCRELAAAGGRLLAGRHEVKPCAEPLARLHLQLVELQLAHSGTSGRMQLAYCPGIDCSTHLSIATATFQQSACETPSDPVSDDAVIRSLVLHDLLGIDKPAASSSVAKVARHHWLPFQAIGVVNPAIAAVSTVLKAAASLTAKPSAKSKAAASVPAANTLDGVQSPNEYAQWWSRLAGAFEAYEQGGDGAGTQAALLEACAELPLPSTDVTDQLAHLCAAAGKELAVGYARLRFAWRQSNGSTSRTILLAADNAAAATVAFTRARTAYVDALRQLQVDVQQECTPLHPQLTALEHVVPGGMWLLNLLYTQAILLCCRLWFARGDVRKAAFCAQKCHEFFSTSGLNVLHSQGSAVSALESCVAVLVATHGTDDSALAKAPLLVQQLHAQLSGQLLASPLVVSPFVCSSVVLHIAMQRYLPESNSSRDTRSAAATLALQQAMDLARSTIQRASGSSQHADTAIVLEVAQSALQWMSTGRLQPARTTATATVQPTACTTASIALSFTCPLLASTLFQDMPAATALSAVNECVANVVWKTTPLALRHSCRRTAALLLQSGSKGAEREELEKLAGLLTVASVGIATAFKWDCCKFRAADSCHVYNLSCAFDPLHIIRTWTVPQVSMPTLCLASLPGQGGLLVATLHPGGHVAASHQPDVTGDKLLHAKALYSAALAGSDATHVRPLAPPNKLALIAEADDSVGAYGISATFEDGASREEYTSAGAVLEPEEGDAVAPSEEGAPPPKTARKTSRSASAAAAKTGGHSGAASSETKRSWWEERFKVDAQMGTVVEYLDIEVLGDAGRALVKEAAATPSPSVDSLSKSLTTIAVTGRVAATSKPKSSKAAAAAASHSTPAPGAPSAPASHRSFALLCCEHTFSFPWEMTPTLAAWETGIVRVPILQCLQPVTHELTTVLPRLSPSLSSPQCVTLVVNPAGDLPKTQERLQPMVALVVERSKTETKSKASAVTFVGRQPDTSTLLTTLQAASVYVYCGHGGGESLLPRKALENAATSSSSSLPECLLMGCSSARMHCSADWSGEPDGFVLALLMAGAPLALGNLWDVTDRDIDRFTEDVVTSWLLPKMQARPAAAPQAGVSIDDLAVALRKGRDVMKLKLLNGAAPVIYVGGM